MKLSLAWIFSHIAQNPFKKLQNDFEKGDFFDAMGQCIAEIERVERIEYPLQDLFIARVIAVQDPKLRLLIPELSQEIDLPMRNDLTVGALCLVIKKKKGFAYVTLADLKADKEGFLGPLWVPESQLTGGWKNDISPWDYILTFDNKSLTHRPDLWGHRGFARELTALFDYRLVPEEYICAALPIRHFATQAPAAAGNAFGLTNQTPQTCTRIAGISLSGVTVQGSLPWMAFRLAAVDARPINTIVDLTNYVMYDLGQPMHAFDQQQIVGNEIRVTRGQRNERVELLDSTAIDLTTDDTVLRDSKQVLALAGIMGGKMSGITPSTKDIFIEAACFNSQAIRMSALHHKLRTQSSTRFEKSLDPHQNTVALLRFIKLMDNNDLVYTPAQALLSLGDLAPEAQISLSHQQIVDKIGMSVTVEQVQTILTHLGCGVFVQETPSGTEYTVTVPTFRATKDISGPHDIIEEVARFIGFNKLPMQLPLIPSKPREHTIVRAKRTIKQQCAFGLNLHEVYNYALYDEAFLEKAHIQPHTVYTVKNPVSQQATRLVTSLIPHLLKNVTENNQQQQACGFFEMGTIWPVDDAGAVHERVALSGLWYAEEPINFYQKKAHLQSLFRALSLSVTWQAPSQPLAPWYHFHQTAELFVGERIIGYAGMAHPAVVKSALERGNAFVFELDATFLCSYQPATPAYHELSKFQSVTTDVSMFVPESVSIDTIEQTIAQADARIYELYIVDYLENQCAVTLRYKAVDQEKSLSKEEIDQLRASVNQAITRLGVTIR